MKWIVSVRAASNLLLALLALAFLFQLVVLAGPIPQEMVWGGRLESDEQGTVMAIVALSIISVMVLITMDRSGRLGSRTSMFGRIGIWLMFVLFMLNTVGNLFALDIRETLIFTPVTLLLTFLCLRLAMGDNVAER